MGFLIQIDPGSDSLEIPGVFRDFPSFSASVNPCGFSNVPNIKSEMPKK